ncbi:hypothetical protein [Nocardioides ochotonae]|uniref:hypothetical protein n=1 Tax=Nocardioides ochotonae TaxID=2685869 RepID=UPI00140A9C99|nr:hypothetical protein [Nocardioides ochotonae]
MAVTPALIAVELGRTAPEPGSAQFLQWEGWIADALLLIEDRLGAPAALNQAKLDYVVRQAVAAHIRQPEDVKRVDVAVDDGRLGKEYRTGRGRVTILDEWWDLLAPKQTTTIFSIDTAGGGGSPHPPWCSRHFGGPTCSCGVALAGRPIYEPEDA